MKYTVALFLGIVKASDGDYGCPCGVDSSSYAPNLLDYDMTDINNMEGHPDDNLLGNNGNTM
jgi:hypothetical protein